MGPGARLSSAVRNTLSFFSRLDTQAAAWPFFVLLTTNHGETLLDRLAVHEHPVPQIEAGGTPEGELQGAMTVGCIDDFGLMVIGPAEAALDAAERRGQRIIDGMKEQKLDVHKFQVGEGLPAAW